MTASEALASIREDIARLAKRTVKPGFIRRKHAEVDAITEELDRLQKEVDRLNALIVHQDKAHRESDLRVGMLANVLSILGFNPMVHLRRPIENADVYYRAAEYVARQERERDFGKPERLHIHRTWVQMKDLLINALWWARLDIATERIDAALPQHMKTNATKEEEEHQAAA